MRCNHLGTAALVALGLFACKSSDKGAATGESVTKAANQIDQGILELDATIASLHTLVDQPTGDLTAHRKAFEKELSKLEDTAEDLAGTATAMKERGQAYFAHWKEQLATIQNEDLRERSEERREEIESKLNELQTDYQEAKGAFEPLLANLRDIRTALKADSTVGGIDAIAPAVKSADKDAGKVSKEMRDLAEGFRELGVNLSRVHAAQEAQK
jgi:chromosome segregation ATPase